jgi:hypothetical protein
MLQTPKNICQNISRAPRGTPVDLTGQRQCSKTPGAGSRGNARYPRGANPAGLDPATYVIHALSYAQYPNRGHRVGDVTSHCKALGVKISGR